MRDLEIRGAGNLLGSEQSGFMASVGYDLYVKMIEETVREMRGDVSQGDIDTRVDIKVDAYLPHRSFREFRPYLGQCRFIGCAHIKEKGCAVLAAVKAGDIPKSRHRSYVRLYELAKENKPWEK